MFTNSLRSLLVIIIVLSFANCKQNNFEVNIAKIDHDRIISAADKYLLEEPVTITSTIAERSAGGIHDFYSEGDYWWPDTENPDSPYVRRDGMTNPENFTAHRKAMVRLSIQVATLAAAYKITGNIKYADKVIEHIKAWFVNDETRMNPNLLYAQAIKGRFTGRGIGIIDTIHLVEVVQAIIVLEKAGVINKDDIAAIKNWFADYLTWMTTHQYGIDERNNGNNHSTCWAIQVAEFAKLTGNDEQLNFCRKMFTDTLIPDQMAKDGSFPKELERTKPYGYALFNLDAMTTLCQIISDDENNYWNFNTPDGRNMKKAVEFMYPFIKDKSTWTYQQDVMYWDDWPVRQPSLLFAGINYEEQKYIDLWKTLNPDPDKEEIIRNYPIRQPVLWVN
ncbi:MAG: alginate lyase [Ignavibacteria bacterium GWB2_35_6b]|nr:MAG: alginate lyase [Ignavibacteria bacterium GWB2_35_6b]